MATDPGKRQEQRISFGNDLSSMILDGTLEWMDTPEGPAILNRDTGELVDDRSAAYAALLSFAADPSNHVSGFLDDGSGSTYLAGTSLWKSSLRIDPNWMEAMRRRSRKRALDAIKRMMDSLSPLEKLARKDTWRQRLLLKLVTLTMPHHRGTDSLSEVKRLNKAIELLKKRKWWKDRVVGGIKGVEDALDADGPHVHAHLLVLAKYMDDGLIEEWRECLDTATWDTYGFGLSEDVIPFVDVRVVSKKKGSSKSPETISCEDAVNETTKYVTKPADFLKEIDGRRISRDVLIAICDVRRWPRMFELMGRCRNTSRRKDMDPCKAALAALDSIHRAYSTGTLPKLPEGTDWSIVEAWDHETDGPEEKRKLVIQALKNLEKDKIRRPRPPSWRDLLDHMSISEWLKIMVGRFRRGKRFRIRKILDSNPNAFLIAFNGTQYGCAPDPVGVA